MKKCEVRRLGPTSIESSNLKKSDQKISKFPLLTKAKIETCLTGS